jgi:hypothetical protein
MSLTNSYTNFIIKKTNREKNTYQKKVLPSSRMVDWIAYSWWIASLTKIIIALDMLKISKNYFSQRKLSKKNETSLGTYKP